MEKQPAGQPEESNQHREASGCRGLHRKAPDARGDPLPREGKTGPGTRTAAGREAFPEVKEVVAAFVPLPADHVPSLRDPAHQPPNSVPSPVGQAHQNQDSVLFPVGQAPQLPDSVLFPVGQAPQPPDSVLFPVGQAHPPEDPVFHSRG